MHYYDWNNLIGNLLFNPGKAGQAVLVYLTKEQIIQTAVSAGHFESEEEAWQDFTRNIRLLCWKREIVSLIKEFTTDSYGIYRKSSNGNIYQTSYPRFLTLLTISVLPLTSDWESDWSIANYYDRAKAYLVDNELPEILKQDKAFNWNEAWESLEEWSSIYKKGALGIFKAYNGNFNGNSYVGKPFSQCLIPPNALRDLPKAFVRAGWVPRQPLSENDWKNLLKNHCNELNFRQAALKTLLTDEGLAYAIPILQERFNCWDGTIYTSAMSQVQVSIHNRSDSIRREKINKEETYARFYLTFIDLDDTEGRFCWQYRIKGSQPLPDVLQLLGHEFTGQLNNWSNGVSIPFQENLQGFDLSNQWRVKWPDADIRLFESGQWHGLSNRVWVETNELSRINQMYAMCKPGLKQILRQWGKTFKPGCFSELLPDEDFDATGWPVDYALFKFERTTQGIPGTRFILSTVKQLKWVGGLKIAYGVYLDCHCPQLQIVNSEGNESVSAFTENGQQIELYPDADNPSLYTFSDELPIDVPVICQLGGHPVSISCQFTKADDFIQQGAYPVLPGRNSFGDVASGNKPIAYNGFRVSGVSESRLPFINIIKQVFYPGKATGQAAFQLADDTWLLGDDLLTYLTCRGECRPTDFFYAYETLLSNAVEQGFIEMPTNVSRTRRWALGWYDALGYVDYDYESGRILVQPPTLIPVPCKRGHRAILVGGRSPELIDQLRQVAELLGVSVSIQNQTEQMYLAPSVVSLYTEESFDRKAYSSIQQVAQQLSIPFLADELPVWRLLECSGSLNDYRETLQPEPEAETTTWTLRVFNPDQLRFERPVHNLFDTSFTLVERQLNAYQFVHYLWINGQSFRVDKNWGRFLVLHHYRKQVIFRRERHNQIAIPATLPLPRVLARGFALLSGKIPVKEVFDFDGIGHPYLLYENAGNILSGNYIQKLGQQIQTTRY